MKSFLLSFTLIITFFIRGESNNSNKETSYKIEVKGKVAAINSSKIVPAKVVIRGPGITLSLDTDSQGKFSTSFAAVSAFTLTVQASGYEKLEQTLSITHLKSDSTIEISASLMPIEKLKLHGMILDKKTSKPVKAEFDLYLDNDIVKEDVEIVDEGKYSETFTSFGWYIIDISAKGYLNLSDTVWILNCKRPDLLRDYYLIPIEAGLTVQLKNIQFNFGKTTLLPDSFKELDDVVELLKKNPSLKLEIGGHTDSDGPDDYNLWLSQSRAQAVVDYLISQGANAEQLVAKGYGETKPIDTSETQLAKSTNRRVEFTVLQN
ncbi:MAG: OmpA family protein [Bacteroidetes bacterium]|nr:OmpA family protein [Bacteroidota bacterium]